LLEGFEDKGIFSFAKVRGSYSEVGNALPFRVANRSPRYSLSNDENINPRGTLPYFNGTDTISLQPERTRSFEFGADVRFFNNKLALNLTYYNATTFNQVFTIGAPAGSGASNFYINGGTIRNKGVEGTISYQGNFGDLKWNPGINFSRNVNQIIELSDLLTTPRFVLTDINSTRQVQLFLTRPVDGEYGSYGDLYGKKIQYGEYGKIIVDKNGLPLLSANPDEYIGNANPDFLLGFNNSFTYKRTSLSFLIDGRFGGKIFSVTETWRDWKGLSKRTAEARDNGGVLVNDQLVDAEAYYKRISGSGQQGAAEMYTFDATNVRLREIALGYTFPSFTNALKNLNISLVSRNLFFIYNNAPFDPEVSIAPANGLQGIEGFNLPSTRSFGLTVKATF
jgi:outer membrane receptor protein involved in Fe transport